MAGLTMKVFYISLIKRNSFTKKVDFHNGISGKCPNSGVIEVNGDLYGVTSGDYGRDGILSPDHGTIYKYSIGSNVVTTLYNFGTSPSSCNKGCCPSGNLVEVNGGLYGMTALGGTNNKGTIYVYNLTTHSFSKKFDFPASTGSNSAGALIQSYSNLDILYGLISQEDPSGNGSIFQFNTSTNTFTVLKSFQSGYHLNGSLYEDSYHPGTLYVTAINYFGDGFVFSYVVQTNTLTIRAALPCSASLSAYASFNQFVDNCYACKQVLKKSNFYNSGMNITLLENPIHSIVKGTITSEFYTNAIIKITDIVGNEIAKKPIELQKGINLFQ